MKEYSGYQMEDIFQVLSRRKINWDGKLRDYIQGEDGLSFTEVDATPSALKNGYINEHIADKRFAWFEVTADSFNFCYQGNVIDCSNEWIEYLTHKYPDYENYCRKYYGVCQNNLESKLASQQDKDSTISHSIMEQLDVLKGKLETLDNLSVDYRLER